MNQQRIREILAKIENVTVAVYGDFCLDAYWILDPRGSEVSEETGLHARAVAKHYYSLGGASNVVANLAALEPKAIRVIGVVGNDLFGRELRRQFDGLGVDTTHLVIQPESFDTVAFGSRTSKRSRSLASISASSTDAAWLRTRRCSKGFATRYRRPMRSSLTSRCPAVSPTRASSSRRTIFSRNSARKWCCSILVTTARSSSTSAARRTTVRPPGSTAWQVARDEPVPAEDMKKYAQNLYRQFSRPVFLTRGPRGIMAVDGEGIHEVPGIQLLKKLDPVGAGDTVTSALALCLGAGVSPREAAEFANFAAAVTVQKLFPDRHGQRRGDSCRRKRPGLHLSPGVGGRPPQGSLCQWRRD